MQIGYYWAYHIKRQEDRIVQVVQGLRGAFLDDGFSVPIDQYRDIEGPLVRRSPSKRPLSEQAKDFDEGSVF